MDQEWTENTYKQTTTMENKLSVDLGMAKNVGDKDAIKSLSLELAKYYCNVGNFKKSISMYQDVLDYAMTSEVTLICEGIFSATIFEGNFEGINLAISNLMTSNSKNKTKRLEHSEKTPIPFISYSEALCYFSQGSYHRCLDIFSKMTLAEHDHQFNDVITPKDACALITISAVFCCDREEISKRILNNSNLSFVMPSESDLYYLLKCLQHSDMTHFSEYAEKSFTVIKMNHYTKPALENFKRSLYLFTLRQYLSSFSSVRIEKVCSLFKLPFQELEGLIFQLNESSQFTVKIDFDQQILRIISLVHEGEDRQEIVYMAEKAALNLRNEVKTSVLKSFVDNLASPAWR